MILAVSQKFSRPPTETDPRVTDSMSSFIARHVGPTQEEVLAMLSVCGFETLDALLDASIPQQIRRCLPEERLPSPLSEHEALSKLKRLAAKNRTVRSFIGQGFSDCITPPVIQRNLIENPGWYTQYTPYQAEISQGRLESLLNYQTVIADLTGLPVSNASLLDESTACAEAMALAFGAKRSGEANKFYVARDCHPQNLAVITTRARAIGIQVCLFDPDSPENFDQGFGVLLQYPGTSGTVRDLSEVISKTHAAGALAIICADILALCLLKTPGEYGADIAVGTSQRFGVPLGFGGPHAAYLAVSDALKRRIPGRLVGISRDSRNKMAYRLSLQTREQHIRRDKATSNICTAQALLANVAAMYAVYHGPEGLTQIANQVYRMAHRFRGHLAKAGFNVQDAAHFDTVTLTLESPEEVSKLRQSASALDVNLRFYDDHRVSITFDETHGQEDLSCLAAVFELGDTSACETDPDDSRVPENLRRKTPFLQNPVFHLHRSETQLLRYLKRLENKDLSLTASMIPLGSCTMKLNAAAEMFPISWPEFNRIHPFAPTAQTEGYQQLFRDLEDWLAILTGFDAVSLQPNAGSQGELAGLLSIRSYLLEQGDAKRNVCLIPQSAHGTNPASAVMAGFRVIPVQCDQEGNVDLKDLRGKVEKYQEELGAIMVTYPSTHGVFEDNIQEICKLIHDHGGQVYMDGANLNAQVGLTSPGAIGADVCHLNLHKTFCIPHGGGGPGMGPIAVAKHLVNHLPKDPMKGAAESYSGAISATEYGSASILPISWMYIHMMGLEGLAKATSIAILNANYLAHQLRPYFPVLYTRHNGTVAHECIIDLRGFKAVTVEDVAKRLMDFGFHAPTISWPVAGTMMIEPTESEDKNELDRFCEAMIQIHAEIMAVENGIADSQFNVLKGAPHTADQIASDAWDKPYSREQAAYPVKSLYEFKYWPPVSRIDNVHGDRNLVCTCPSVDQLSSD